MSQWKRVLIVVGIGLFGLLVSYIVGRLQTASAIEAAESRVTLLTAASVQDMATCQGLRTVEQALVERLEARRSLHLALIALDEHNFGVAQTHLQNASRKLSTPGQGSDPELTELSNQLGKVHLVAAENVGEQHSRVLSIVKRFDQLVPPR